MIESTIYRCEICGATYTSRNECVACEVFHARLPMNNRVIENTRYLPKCNGNLAFPCSVVIRFADGRRAFYDYRMEMPAQDAR